jgi:hypothetical protein
MGMSDFGNKISQYFLWSIFSLFTFGIRFVMTMKFQPAPKFFFPFKINMRSSLWQLIFIIFCIILIAMVAITYSVVSTMGSNPAFIVIMIFALFPYISKLYLCLIDCYVIVVSTHIIMMIRWLTVSSRVLCLSHLSLFLCFVVAFCFCLLLRI